MNLPSIFRPRLLPSERSRDILQLPREDGRKRTRLAPILIGGSRLRFLSFHEGRRNGRRSLHPLAGLLSSTDYWFGKVPVALFSVIILALFSVIAFFANMAQWTCFWLSTGPLFGYHLQLLKEEEREAPRPYSTNSENEQTGHGCPYLAFSAYRISERGYSLSDNENTIEIYLW